MGKEHFVRTYYNDGKEIIPSEIGDYKSKEPSASVCSDMKWSIKEKGEYVLFYFRHLIVEGAENVPIRDLPFVEELPRAWAAREVNGGRGM